MRYLLPDKTYQVLKWLGLVCCPTLAVFYGTCAPLWNWPAPAATTTTINAIGVLIGALIGVSQATTLLDQTSNTEGD